MLFAVPVRLLRSIAHATMRLFAGLAMMAALCSCQSGATASPFPVPEPQPPAVSITAVASAETVVGTARDAELSAIAGVVDQRPAGAALRDEAAFGTARRAVPARQPLCARCLAASGERAPPVLR